MGVSTESILPSIKRSVKRRLGWGSINCGSTQWGIIQGSTFCQFVQKISRHLQAKWFCSLQVSVFLKKSQLAHFYFLELYHTRFKIRIYIDKTTLHSQNTFLIFVSNDSDLIHTSWRKKKNIKFSCPFVIACEPARPI